MLNLNLYGKNITTKISRRQKCKKKFLRKKNRISLQALDDIKLMDSVSLFRLPLLVLFIRFFFFLLFKLRGPDINILSSKDRTGAAILVRRRDDDRKLQPFYSYALLLVRLRSHFHDMKMSSVE